MKRGISLFILSCLLSTQLLWGQVNASFNVATPSGCSPLVVTFTDQSTGPVTSWLWNFGNGNTSTQQNPAAAYLSSGIYTVSLIVSDGINFDTAVMPGAVTVFQDPDPSFSVSQTIGCAPLSVQFNDQTQIGDAPIQSYIWDFGDGVNASTANPSHTYTNPGTYSITMIPTDSNGCSADTISPGLISVVPTPTASFSANPTSGCVVPHVVNFTDNSSGTGAMSYLWDFGDGNTSSLANPSHSYSNFGSYSVTLVVTDASGCSDTITQSNLIQINSLVADFSVSDTVICEGESVTFTDLSNPPSISSTWIFGDGNSSTALSPSHAYNTAGTYSVTLQASANGCSASETKTALITVNPRPTASFTAPVTVNCQTPFTVDFQDQSTGATSWLWNFGDGNNSTQQNPSHTYTSGSSFNVSLTVNNVFGCSDQVQQNNFVSISPPVAAFLADTFEGCVPLNVQFTDQSNSVNPIVSWFWDLGNGTTSTQQNPATTYTSQGFYDVSLIIVDSAGCTDTLNRPAYVMAGDTVHVDFVVNDTVLCIEDAAIFTNLSDSSTNWFWQYGDGQTSTDFEPTYQYSDTGYWTVSLTTVNMGCRSTSEKIDYIYVSPPDARFDYVVNCANPYEIQFTNTSLAPDVWNWDFGTGGDSSYAFSPIFTFPDTGIFNVTVWVADTTTGCDDSESRNIYVADPIAQFSATPLFGCNPLTVQFTDESIQAAQWHWDFGDGATSTARNPVHTYTVNDTFTVRLVVTDVNGCTDTFIQPDYIIVIGPTADFIGAPQGGCLPLSVQFNDLSTTLGNHIVSWHWEFGDGDTSNLQNPVHVYTSTGFFNVRLTVTDDFGCVHTLTRNQYIHVTDPLADFTVAKRDLCPAEITQFNSTSTGYQLTYAWSFSDGSAAAGPNGNISFNSPGTYGVQLIVTDGYGCVDTILRPNYITVDEPEAEFYGNPIYASCPPLQANFFDTSFGAAAAQWQWQFGNGSGSTLQNPSHVYTAPGMYDVTLIITTAGGCRDTIVKQDYVQVDGPNGTYVLDPPVGCTDHTVTFSGQTQNAASVIWDFGDGSVLPDGDTTVHTYTNPGVFLPLMILNDGLGCTYVVDLNDTVTVGTAQASFSVQPNAVCLGNITQFDGTAVSSPGNPSYRWFFGDGASSTQQYPVHTYTSSGQYDITFIVENSLCVDTMTVTQAVYVNSGPTAVFAVSDTEACEPATIQFTDQSIADTTISSWFWDFGDGSTSTQPNPSHTFSSAGTYEVKLIVTNIVGCPDSTTRTILVHPIPTAVAGSSATICEGDSVQLIGSGGNDFLWSPAAFLADSEIPNPLAFPSSTTTFTLTVTNQFGCQDSDTVTVTVIPLPTLAVTPDTSICIGESLQLQATGALSYQWDPSTELSCTNCPNPVASPTQTRIYHLTGTGTFGCSNSDTVRVAVYPNPNGLTYGDTSFCLGDSAQLMAIGGSSYQWFPSLGLSCSNCPNPIAAPSDSMVYSVFIENIFGCSLWDTASINVVPYPHMSPIPDQTICLGDTAWISTSGADIYNWTPVQEITCATCPNTGLFPVSNRRYYLEAANNFGCTVYDSLDVTVNPVPQVEAGAGALVCQGVSINLQGSGNALVYQWTPSSWLSDPFVLDPLATPDTTTIYTLTGWNQFNCTSSDTVSVRVIPGIDIALDTAFDICRGDQVQLNPDLLLGPNDPIEYQWTPAYYLNFPQTINPVANPNNTTTYTLIARSGDCRPDTLDVTVTVHDLPWVNAGQNQTVVAGTTVQLIAEGSNDVAIAWDPSDGFSCPDCFYPEFIAESDGQYTATVTDEWGCSASDSVAVSVIEECEGDVLFVPSAFSPNGDGNNDLLRVRSIGLQGIAYFRVFDRWGNLIFETEDIEQAWDGTYKGSAVNGGVFVWLVKAICSNGDESIKKGNVTLLR